MFTKFTKFLTPDVRRWMYRVLLALLPILAAYGKIAESDVPLIVALVAAVLGIGVAEVNTPSPDQVSKVAEVKNVSYDRRNIGNPFDGE